MRGEATIEVNGLRKRFGPTLALDGMSFTVRPGRVTGFVGPNGAGKSTTMRVVLGLDAADEGTALVGGRPYRSLREPLRHVGALLDAAALQPSRSARGHLLWLAHSQGLGARRVDEVIEQVGLRSAARRKAGGFSLGMRQRLGIAAALLGDPPVLMLDEPVNGLDPEGVIWIRGLLRSLAAQGRAVLVSSHLMGELQGTADHLIVVGRGRVIADTGVTELIAAVSRGRVAVRTPEPERAMRTLARAGATVTVSGSDALAVSRSETFAASGNGPLTVSGGEAFAVSGGEAFAVSGGDLLTVSGLPGERIVALLTADSVPFSEVVAQRATLEEAYLELTRDAVEFHAGTGREAVR
ncbi:ATP-binding cassette domain-containing protein [Actinoallomurus soli]|uniref:ATP-binding cassette domain-containing protein n=1 Tax=Actinoallomurus soli TaxID=2952535 RepID=UPI0020925384|nr:ATP-binding cassette domain-containing protein [Actinoallomurus soli]MCO5968451.1 ATP-binding cassette domain-containing protein [Actinoallomurus soli]